MVITVLDEIRPAPRYATVMTVDLALRTAGIQFPGESVTFSVPFGADVPIVSSTVRVAGKVGSRYIEDVTTGHAGWRHIGSGTQSSLTVAVPTGCKRVRYSWSGNNSVDAYLQARINADSTAALHVRSHFLETPSGTNSDSIDGTTGTIWRIGSFLGTLLSWGSLEIDCINLRAPFSCLSYRAGIPAGMVRQQGYGHLASDRTVTSVEMSVSAGTLSSLNWIAEGYF